MQRKLALDIKNISGSILTAGKIFFANFVTNLGGTHAHVVMLKYADLEKIIFPSQVWMTKKNYWWQKTALNTLFVMFTYMLIHHWAVQVGFTSKSNVSKFDLETGGKWCKIMKNQDFFKKQSRKLRKNIERLLF